MKITPLHYGDSVLSEDMIFLNGDKNKVRKIQFKIYLIETPDKLILVDAGCETMPGFVMENFIGPLKALENFNVTPEEITDILITHAHHDHIECVKYFNNAIIHIEKKEYEIGKKYIPADFKINIFSDKYLISEGISIIKIGGHSIGSCVVEIIDNDIIYVIAGDECYSRECLIRKITTGYYVNLKASSGFIEKYSNSTYKVLLCHDD